MMKGSTMTTLSQEPMIAKSNDFLSYDYKAYDYYTHHKTYESDESAPKSKDGIFVSESTYWELYNEDPDFTYEWNDGQLEEKPMPNSLSDLTSQWLRTIIYYFLKVNPIAREVVSELAFSLTMKNKKVIRKPDYAIILNVNTDQLEDYDCSYKGTYDLCIEYLSDTKKKYVKRDTEDKKKEYRSAQVKEYFIIDSKKKYTAFYRLTKNKKGTGHYYKKIKPINGIICSEVLPGFQFREKDLYLLPDPEKLYKDDVYKSFVKVDFQEERLAKEKAINKFESERLAKEKEKLAKEKAIDKFEKERLAKEKERLAKEKAIDKFEKERLAKEKALKELELLKKKYTTHE